MSEEKAKELGVKPLATWVAGALAGVEPEVMGLGPIAATKKVMAKTGLTVARHIGHHNYRYNDFICRKSENKRQQNRASQFSPVMTFKLGERSVIG